ncbi:MAG: amidase [Planctomycetes bacterium]|nr:amidase [Planctomycetota bacterium]
MQTIHAAADAIKRKEITPTQLVEQCLTAIERWEKHVHAWVFVDADYARGEAKRLEADLARGFYRGPLHGMPIGVKDIYDVYDWPTACGSKLWANSISRQDAAVVASLREAGAIFLGKTVTTQYASFDPPVTKNPWNLAHTPGGSSSGSAAAVATGMCLAALGSQTGGSITRPASYCGIAGCKPTYGLLPLDGIMPLAHSMDHPGPMAHNATDLAILLRGMCDGWAPNDSINFVEKAAVPVSRPRFGRLRQLFDENADDTTRDMMDEIVHRFAEDGASVEEFALPAAFSDVVRRHRIVMAVEAAQYHEPRFRRHPEDYSPRISQLLKEGLDCPASEYARTKQHQQELTQAMGLSIYGDLVLLCPATTCPAPLADTTGDPAFNSPWSYTGLPTISLQTGYFVDGLPLAIQLVAGPNREDVLFSTAAWCEKRLAATPLQPPYPEK